MSADNVLRPQRGCVPHSESRVSAPYWQGCRAQELRYQRCAECGTANFPPTEHCRECLAISMVWTRSGGRGEIYSWTVVYRPVTADFESPYAPAVVTLDEGYQMLTNIIGVAPVELSVGMRVRVEFHTAGTDLTLPYFTKAG
ncbi:Zn-ribbon domain-containing OB-fold protein [Mycobacterium sp. ML4]